MQKISKAVGAAGLAAATVISGLSFGSVAASAAPVPSGSQTVVKAAGDGTVKIIFQSGSTFYTPTYYQSGTLPHLTENFYDSSSTLEGAMRQARTLTVVPSQEGRFGLQYGKDCYVARTSAGLRIAAFRTAPSGGCGTSEDSRWSLVDGELVNQSSGLAYGTPQYRSSHHNPGDYWVYENLITSGGKPLVGDIGALTPVVNGGFDADGVGTPTTIVPGSSKAVTFGAKVTAGVTAMTGTDVTLTAPSGTAFRDGQTKLVGQFKAAGSTEWATTSSLTVTGQVSSGGSRFTGTIADTGSDFRLPAGTEVRWTADVTALADANEGSGNLGFTVAGTTDLAAFSVTGQSQVTIASSTIVPGTTAPVDLERGKTTDVPFVVENKTDRRNMVGTVEVSAPAGTTFAEGQTTVAAEFRKGSNPWAPYALLNLKGGVLNADKTKLTFTVDTTTAGNMLAGEEYRYTLRVNTPAAAAAGDSKLQYVYQGTSTAGDYRAAGSTTTKLADVSDPADLVVKTPANGSTVTVKRPVFSGTGEPGAAIEVSGSTKVVATATVDPEGKWTADAKFDLVDGNYNLTAKQSPVGGTPSTTSVKFTVKTVETIAPVTVTSPAAGSITDDRTPTFTGTGHNGATITVRGSQTVLDTATVVDGEWELTSKVSLPNGDYDLYVDQTVKGKTTTIRHKITVNNPLTASIKVVTPKQGTPLTEVDTLRPTFTGTATPGAAITIGSSRTTIATGTADARGNWTATATSDLAAGGTYNLTAKQSKGGKESTAPAAFTVSSKASSIRPIVLTAPAQNATVDTVRPTFTGTATPNATITVGSSRTTIATGTADGQGKFSFPTNVDLERGGTYSGLTVRQVTSDERTSTTTSSFVVAKDADADKLARITVSSPAKDEVVTTVRPTFVGTATPGATITIGSSKTTVATGEANESGAFSIPASIDLKPGLTYTNLGVKQEKGGVTNSTTISFSVAKDADTGKLEELSVSSPTQNEVVDTVRPTFVGKATPGASIRVHSSKTTVASGTADSKGDFSIQAQADLARGGTYAGLTVTQQKGDLTDSSTKISFSVARNAS